MVGVLAGLRGRLAAFARDRRGSVAIWGVLLAPPLLGVAALAVDLSRVYSLEAEMQSAADALARAGAVELDGSSTAISRANLAITNLVENDQRFADDGRGRVTVEQVRFLSALPASDATAVSAAQVTTNPRLARFVEISTAPKNLTTLFPVKLVGALATTSVRAQSIAARSARMCSAAPLFICNPVEDSGLALDEALEAGVLTGKQVLMRSGGTYAPGQFGYLEPPSGHGASDLKDMFAEVNPSACYDSAGVTLRTGKISSVDQGMNTRFGLYPSSYKNSEAQYPAAAITASYPKDNCFGSGGCTRNGDGVWSFQAYMKARYPAMTSVTIGNTSYAFNHATNTVTPSNARPSRFQVYRWEIEQAALSEHKPDRRVIPVAVLNCQSENLSAPRVPVAAFAKVFLTEPMGSGTDNAIWGEIVGLLRQGSDAQARDHVDVRR